MSAASPSPCGGLVFLKFLNLKMVENGLQTALEDSACSEKDLQVEFVKMQKKQNI